MQRGTWPGHGRDNDSRHVDLGRAGGPVRQTGDQQKSQHRGIPGNHTIDPPDPLRERSGGIESYVDVPLGVTAVGAAAGPAGGDRKWAWVSWEGAPATAGASTGRPPSARSMSARISDALWYRSSTRLAKAFRVIASTSGGTVDSKNDGGDGSSRTCW